MRFTDSPGLFGHGAGAGTYGNITCDWCGKDYLDRESEEGDSFSDESIGVAWFGSKQICDCCFEAVEEAVLNHIDDIIPWFIEILASKRTELEDSENMIARLKKGLEG